MLALVLVSAVLAETPAADAAPDYKQIVARALQFVDGDGAEIEKDATCVNCHHAVLRTWALSDALRLNVGVDAKALQETRQAQQKRVVELKDDYRDKQWGHTLSAFFLLAGIDETVPETKAGLTSILVAEQTPEGTWKPANQFNGQRRPKKDAEQAQTLWALLALGRLEDRAEVAAARERGLKWLGTQESGTTIDVRVLRLLVEQRFGTPARTKELLAQLLAEQHADGGWGWQPDDPSDAWAVGLALYALSELGDHAPAGEIGKAQAFLARTQREDGGWLVEGKLGKKPEMASYFGTLWAVIGLSRTLPKSAAK